MYRNFDKKDSINTVWGTMEIYYYEEENNNPEESYYLKRSYEFGILTIKDSKILISYYDDSFNLTHEEMSDITYQGKLKEIIPQLFEEK